MQPSTLHIQFYKNRGSYFLLLPFFVPTLEDRGVSEQKKDSLPVCVAVHAIRVNFEALLRGRKDGRS